MLFAGFLSSVDYMDFVALVLKMLSRNVFFLIAERGGWIPGSASRRCRDLSEDDERGRGDDEVGGG